MKENLGALIKRTRSEKDISKEELAKRLGVSPSTISKWEKNISRPSFSYLILLTKELNISMDEFILGHKIEKDNKKEGEEKIKQMVRDNAKYKTVFNAFTGVFACLSLCFLELILFKNNVDNKDANYIFLLIIFMIYLISSSEALEKANLLEDKNKYKEFAIILILGFILSISGFIIRFVR